MTSFDNIITHTISKKKNRIISSKSPTHISKSASTAIKLISKYADSYNILNKENEFLKAQIQSLKQNIQLNKDIINYFYSTDLSNSNHQRALIELLKQDNEKLLVQNTQLLKDKCELQKKVKLLLPLYLSVNIAYPLSLIAL